MALEMMNGGPDAEVFGLNPVAAVAKMIGLMAAADDAEIGVAELTKAFDASPALLRQTLEQAYDAGLIAPRPAGQWSLGWELFRIAALAQRKMPYAKAQPALDELSAATGETAVLSVYDPGMRGRMFVACSASLHSVRFVPELFDWAPMYKGATAIAVLAHRSVEEQRRIHEAADRDGMADALSWENFRDRLATVKRAGFAISRDELDLGASAVAVPVLTPSGVTCSVGVAAPAQRFDQLQHDLVIRAATEVAVSLGQPQGANPAPSSADLMSATRQRW